MSVEVDGELWQLTPTAQYLNGALELTGVTADGAVIALHLEGLSEGQHTVGPHTANQMTCVRGGLHPALFSNRTNGASATVSISAFDETVRTVSGTFEARLINPLTGAPITLKRGTFKDVPYPAFAPQTGASSLRVTIDGVPWVAAIVLGQSFDGQLRLIATDPTGMRSVVLQMASLIAPGTYGAGNLYAQFGAQYRPDAESSFWAKSGELTVDYHDKTGRIIGGAFRLQTERYPDGAAKASLSDGRFLLRY